MLATPEYIKSVTGNQFEQNEYLLFKTGIDILRSTLKSSGANVDEICLYQALPDPWKDFRSAHACSIWTDGVYNNEGDGLMLNLINMFGIPDDVRHQLSSNYIDFLDYMRIPVPETRSS